MIDKKYSLRVELDKTEEDKLRAIANRMGLSLADSVRNYIASSPATYTPEDFEAFKRENDRLFKKLVAWQTKHISRGFVDKYAKEIAQTTVNDYLAAVVLAQSQSQLVSVIEFWDSKLCRQEKTAVSKVFPFSVSSLVKGELIDDWLGKSDWYNMQGGEYVVLAETVLDAISYEGQDVGVITENAYDAEILNTDRMMIVDVDIFDEADNKDCATVINPDVAIVALEAFTEKYNLGFRVYRTFAGLRYICTTEEVNPNSYLSYTGMKMLLADPKYQMLCRFQETYRARLTPKPWRVEDDADYYATAKLVKVVGDDRILDSFKDMVDYHDRTVKVDSDLPLA